MFHEEFLEEGEKHPTLGPSYFEADVIAEKIVSKFNETHFQGLIDDFTKKFNEALWSDVENFLLSDTQSNIQNHIYRMVDNSVEALLTGKEWALTRYVLNDRYNSVDIRDGIFKIVPEELKEQRIKDLESELKKQKKMLSGLGEDNMSAGLYRVYTKGDGYVTPIKKWEFVAAFVQAEDAEDWIGIQMNDVPPEEDIEYKIMKDGKNI